MDVKRIMVVGSGTMGAGIAQMAAQAGYKVILRDVDEKFLSKGMETIRNSLERFVKKGTLTTAQRDEALANVKTTMAIADASGVDLVIEAITENRDLKIDLFRELDKVCSASTLFASNTSSLSVTEMALAT